MIYLLDTTTVSDLMAGNKVVLGRVDAHLASGDQVCICRPVHYELMRGLLWKDAHRKVLVLRDDILPNLGWVSLEDEDWLVAAEFWAKVVKAGRRLSDVDLLVAAMSARLGAVVVTSDDHLEELPIQHENWR